jgi:hypothetical protein
MTEVVTLPTPVTRARTLRPVRFGWRAGRLTHARAIAAPAYDASHATVALRAQPLLASAALTAAALSAAAVDHGGRRQARDTVRLQAAVRAQHTAALVHEERPVRHDARTVTLQFPSLSTRRCLATPGPLSGPVLPSAVFCT